MPSHYSVRPVKDCQEWDIFLNAVYKPHLMQSYAYGEAKRIAQNWHINRLVFECGNTPVAICQVLEKRVAGMRVASRINRGPLFIDEMPSYEVKENIYQLLRNQWKYLMGGILLFAPALEPSDENNYMLHQLGFIERKKVGWCSSLIDLAQDESEIRRNLSSTWRNRLKSALNSGMALHTDTSTENVEWMLNKHRENMCAKDFKGPSIALLSALQKIKPCDFTIMKAILNGEALGGMIVVRFGQSSEYYIGWFGAEGRKWNVGNYLYWNSILEMKKAGCRWFDLGGYDASDKYGHFKQSMRGREYRLMGEWISY